jgi:hypothetical protein
MSKPPSRAEAALDELCVKYGYCVPVDEIDAVLAQAPERRHALPWIDGGARSATGLCG